MKKRTVYRDSETGRFASKASWVRSKAHGGTRYVRSSVSYHPPEPKPEREEREEEEAIEELEDFEEAVSETKEEDLIDEDWTGAFDTGKGKKK